MSDHECQVSVPADTSLRNLTDRSQPCRVIRVVTGKSAAISVSQSWLPYSRYPPRSSHRGMSPLASLRLTCWTREGQHGGRLAADM